MSALVRHAINTKTPKLHVPRHSHAAPGGRKPPPLDLAKSVNFHGNGDFTLEIRVVR